LGLGACRRAANDADKNLPATPPATQQELTHGQKPSTVPKASAATNPAKPDSDAVYNAPNIVLVTIDTLRADHLGCYGYFRDTSPNIDALAKESIRFTHCFTPVAQTLPSHTSIMTRTYPLEHGALANVARFPGQIGVRFVPTLELKTLAQYLVKQGYVTAGFVSATPVKEESGLASGFGIWDEPDYKTRRAEDTNKVALAWLAKQNKQPFLMWIHYFDCHAPYDLPQEYATPYTTDEKLTTFMDRRQVTRKIQLKGAHRPKNPQTPKIRYADEQTNSYDGEIRYVDVAISKLLNLLHTKQLWDHTVFVLAADHGEGLGQHQNLGHGDIWNEQLHVPLILHVPGQPARTIDQPISLVDVFPTVFGLAGQVPASEFLNQCTGTNVLAQSKPHPLFSQRPGKGNVYTLQKDGWKYILNKEGDQLYNLNDDPFELKNVIEDYPNKVASLKKILLTTKSKQESLGKKINSGRNKEDIIKLPSKKTLRELKGLGYTGDEDDDDEQGNKN